MPVENLAIWQRSTAQCIAIYKYFMPSREYGFKEQITRSALSIPSNIAEGMERLSDREKYRFLEIAKGSSAELSTQIYIGVGIGLIDEQTGHAWMRENKEIAAMIAGLMKTLLAARS
ncbi:MAG: four helix bundle protein [Oceanospirillaceae bacterium]|nr:four helix bundle protein [Oceanospirillaceae bacterium]MCP5335942.1 four helix bundle protein [Oceanospirillaceae bacterium]MCP5349941.1 four helix bundle protein [Oceanospirillaceae bacterium]